MNGVHVLRAARRSCFVPTALAVLVALAVLLVEKPARADDERPRAYFYKDLPYGSQSLFNPIYAIVNRGYDAYQLRSDKAFGQTRSSDVENVWENFSNPFPALAARTPDATSAPWLNPVTRTTSVRPASLSGSTIATPSPEVSGGPALAGRTSSARMLASSERWKWS